MRAVQKGAGHFALLTRYVNHQAELLIGVASVHAWDNFNAKAGTRASCLAEQRGLCAYSEIRLEDTDLGMHIDHVKPKSKFPAHTFNHRNLLLSAIDNIGHRNLAKQDVFGGHARGNRYYAQAFIHPRIADCRDYFHYSSDGRIKPRIGLSLRDRRRAAYTIGAMNLNASFLVGRRRRWLEELELQINNLLEDETALQYFAQTELCETNGRLRPFHTAARERFGQLGDQVIANDCPECG